jgi:hypothetical protein
VVCSLYLRETCDVPVPINLKYAASDRRCHHQTPHILASVPAPVAFNFLSHQPSLIPPPWPVSAGWLAAHETRWLMDQTAAHVGCWRARGRASGASLGVGDYNLRLLARYKPGTSLSSNQLPRVPPLATTPSGRRSSQNTSMRTLRKVNIIDVNAIFVGQQSRRTRLAKPFSHRDPEGETSSCAYALCRAS